MGWPGMRALVVLAVLAGGAVAQDLDGTVAAPSRWNLPRGTAAGTYRSSAMPILGDIEQAWSFPLTGEPAGPPVLWDGIAYVLCRAGTGRALFAVDLQTGERRAKKTFPPGPMSPPVIADGLVIVHVTDKQLIGYRLARSTFQQRWKPVTRDLAHIGELLPIGREVYFLADGREVYRLDVGKPKPIWRSRNFSFAGRLAASGNHIFALHHAERPGYEASLQVVTFHRADGRESGAGNVAWYQSKVIPADNAGATIAVMADRIYVHGTAPLASSIGGLPYASLPFRITAASVWFDEHVGLEDIQAPPSWHPDGTLYLATHKGMLKWYARKGNESWTVTTAGDQPDLFRHRLPATVFGSVAYFGTWAADLETEEILWRLPVEKPRFAAVPADRFALVIDGDTLRGFREKGTAGPAQVRGKGDAPAVLAVGRNGDVLDGELSVSFAAATLHRKKKEYDLRDFYVVEQDGGKLVWAPDFPGRVRGYEFLARARRIEALVRITKEAAKAKAGVARAYLRQAEAIGLDSDDAESLEKRVLVAERKPKTPDPEDVKRWAAEAGQARGLLPALLAERARVEIAKGDAGTGLELLREALRRGPACAPALALLKTQAPKDFALGDARFWLDLNLDLKAAGATVASDDELELKRARFHWRKDLYGLRAGPVLMITPVRDTAVVSRCMAYGRMTCRVLGKLFATDTPHERRATPLTIHLLGSQKEYEQRSGVYSRLEDPEFLKWTVGHYAPTEGVSRFYWFKDPAKERRIGATCVHELTHHWLREQNPRYAVSQVRRRASAPGHWIVEGFASFMEEGLYDVERGTWNLFNPRSRSLDYVRAFARAGKLIDWKRLYAITSKDFGELRNKSDTLAVSRWSLGRRKLSERGIFYKQAAATCTFLYHADGGKHREQLLDFVVHNYTGKADRMDPKTAFGMDAATLGRRVIEFAAQVAKGWRPKGG